MSCTLRTRSGNVGIIDHGPCQCAHAVTSLDEVRFVASEFVITWRGLNHVAKTLTEPYTGHALAANYLEPPTNKLYFYRISFVCCPSVLFFHLRYVLPAAVDGFSLR